MGIAVATISMVMAGTMPAAAKPTCPNVTNQIAAMKVVLDLDKGIDIYQGRDFHWNEGPPPEAITASKEISGSIFLATGSGSLLSYADSIVWSNIDMDGDGDRELIAVTNFLQGRLGRYYNLTSLYVFCRTGDRTRLCAEASFSNPPVFNLVRTDGSRQRVSDVPAPDYEIGPAIRLAILTGVDKTHMIAVLPDNRGRTRTKLDADVYSWSGPSASFNLICRVRQP